MRRTIYLDYNATTPLDPGVREVMLPFIDNVFGNPSSIHRIGQQARSKLDQSRESVAAAWRCKPSEVVFTSGGTESNNLAIFGAARRLREKGRHLIASSIEHHSVLHCFQYLKYQENYELTLLPVDASGMVSVDDLQQAIRPDTILVSVMAANNETGTVQPVEELGALCQERGVCFHTDASQWFGKKPFTNIDQFNAALVTACAHKFYGPKGAGALFIRSPFPMHSILMGGGQENEKRAGTENMACIAGLTYAMEKFVREPVFPEHPLRLLTERLIEKLEQIDGLYSGVIGQKGLVIRLLLLWKAAIVCR